MTPHEQASINWLESPEGQKALEKWPAEWEDESGLNRLKPRTPTCPPKVVRIIGDENVPRHGLSDTEALAVTKLAWEGRLGERTDGFDVCFGVGENEDDRHCVRIWWDKKFRSIRAATILQALAKALEAVGMKEKEA